MKYEYSKYMNAAYIESYVKNVLAKRYAVLNGDSDGIEDDIAGADIHKSEIESNYFELRCQTWFANYFMLYLGCDAKIINDRETNGIKHEKLESSVAEVDKHFKLKYL